MPPIFPSLIHPPPGDFDEKTLPSANPGLGCPGRQHVRCDGPGEIQDRPGAAHDGPAGHHRPPDRSRCTPVYGAAWRHGSRQEDRADRQGRHQPARPDAPPRARADRQRQGQRAGRHGHHAFGHGRGTAGHAKQDAAGGDGCGHVQHHRSLAVHRAHQLHAAASLGGAGRLGTQERHQESGDAGVRLRPGHRRREVLQGTPDL